MNSDLSVGCIACCSFFDSALSLLSFFKWTLILLNLGIVIMANRIPSKSNNRTANSKDQDAMAWAILCVRDRDLLRSGMHNIRNLDLLFL